MSNEDKAVNISARDLKEIISGAVAEAVKAAKAPNEIEQQKLDQQKLKIQQDNQTRVEQAEQIKQEMANKAFRKSVCAHQSGTNHPHTVFVSDDLGGYVLCQKCTAIIRPENQLSSFPKDFRTTRPDVIFDNALFNRVFQTTNTSGVFA